MSELLHDDYHFSLQCAIKISHILKMLCALLTLFITWPYLFESKLKCDCCYHTCQNMCASYLIRCCYLSNALYVYTCMCMFPEQDNINENSHIKCYLQPAMLPINAYFSPKVRVFSAQIENQIVYEGF